MSAPYIARRRDMFDGNDIFIVVMWRPGRAISITRNLLYVARISFYRKEAYLPLLLLLPAARGGSLPIVCWRPAEGENLMTSAVWRDQDVQAGKAGERIYALLDSILFSMSSSRSMAKSWPAGKSYFCVCSMAYSNGVGVVACRA